MSRRGRIALLLTLLVADSLGVVVGLLAAFIARNSPLFGATITLPDYLPLLIWALPVYLPMLAFSHLYDLETVLENSQEYATVATACTYSILGLLVVSTFAIAVEVDRLWLVFGWLGSMFFVALGRFLMRRVVRAFRRANHLIVRAVIVGADEQGRTIARQFRNEADSGVRVVGFIDDFLPLDTEVQDGLRVIGHPGELSQLAEEHRIAEVIVVPGALGWETFHDLVRRSAFADSLRIRISPGFYDLLATTPRVAHRNFVPLILMDRVRLTGFDRMLKTLFDYGLGSLILLLCLPLMLLIAVLLKLAGHGPTLEKWPVLGLGGRTFNAIHFHVAPDRPLGRFFTNTGLHNLPLLFLLLSGKMSLIGPRPVRTEDSQQYRSWLPTLATVKPGISGPWAVVPVAGVEEEMRAALYYIRNWTIWLDLQILIQTLLVILRQRWERLSE